jgi:ParB family chromosome partitioning protein
MPEQPQVVEIDIAELGIDRYNIRQGVWNYDEELINSIRKSGIINPLLVRPVPLVGNLKYGVVCGSRRYNAALDAGLSKVRCFIRELTDIEAMEQSMMENRQRVDTPTWMDIEYVGMMYNIYRKHGLSHQDARDVITRTGISPQTVERYLHIYKLPEEVKGLMRDTDERTTKQKEVISLYCAREPNRLLPIGHAGLLFNIIDLPLEKQMEVAIFITNMQQGKIEQLIQLVKDNPTINVEELHQRLLQKYGVVYRRIQLEKIISDALSEVCMQKQIQADILIIRIIKEWLIDHGFFSKTRTPKEELGDIKTASKVNRGVLTSAGYKFLKSNADAEIYQKSVKGGSGFIKILLYKSGIGILRMTAGSYDDSQAEEILLRERDLIEGIKVNEKK